MLYSVVTSVNRRVITEQLSFDAGGCGKRYQQHENVSVVKQAVLNVSDMLVLV